MSREGSPPPTFHVSNIVCHVLFLMFHVSYVSCHVSHVFFCFYADKVVKLVGGESH